MNDIVVMFQEWKVNRPTTYRTEISVYLETISKLLEEKDKLFFIAVLSAFRQHSEWKENHREIYDQYQNTQFLIKKLTEEDRYKIVSYYVKKNHEIGKEVLHV